MHLLENRLRKTPQMKGTKAVSDSQGPGVREVLDTTDTYLIWTWNRNHSSKQSWNKQIFQNDTCNVLAFYLVGYQTKSKSTSTTPTNKQQAQQTTTHHRPELREQTTAPSGCRKWKQSPSDISSAHQQHGGNGEKNAQSNINTRLTQSVGRRSVLWYTTINRVAVDDSLMSSKNIDCNMLTPSTQHSLFANCKKAMVNQAMFHVRESAAIGCSNQLQLSHTVPTGNIKENTALFRSVWAKDTGRR